jgi:hypothetical protein
MNLNETLKLYLPTVCNISVKVGISNSYRYLLITLLPLRSIYNQVYPNLKSGTDFPDKVKISYLFVHNIA